MLACMTGKRLFISWSKESHGVASAMRPFLQTCIPGLTVWMSSDAIKAGQKWRDEIDAALRESDVAVLCLGPGALDSPWVAYEAGAIGHRRPTLPVLLHLQADDLPATLQHVQAIESFAPDEDDPAPGFGRQLVDAVAALTGLLPEAQLASTDALNAALTGFSAQRIQDMQQLLRKTRKFDALVHLLELVEGAPNISPSKLAESGLVKADFVKKFNVVLSVFFLIELRLMKLRGFIDPSAGVLQLTPDGSRLLRAFRAGER